MNILTTGGAGFIGSHLVDKLISLGHQVVIIDDLSTGQRSNVSSAATLIVKDINDDLDDIFNKYQFDYVFHLAAQINLRSSIKDPVNDAIINILGSLNIIQSAKKYGVKKIIFASTGGAIYSPQAELPCHETSLVEPASPYGLSKFTVENYLRLSQMPYVALRFANVYGPRQNNKSEAGVLSIFINQILKQEIPTIFGTGQQTRDFVFVEDVVNACILGMQAGIGNFNVSTGIETSLNHIVAILQQQMGYFEVQNTQAIPGELMRSCLSYDKIKKEMGWTPSFNLEVGIEKTINYFKGL